MSAPPLSDAHSILQHLDLMASICRGAVVSSAGRQIFGELGYPHPETGETTFMIHPALRGLVAPPKTGQVVQVEYQTDEARYGFVTQVNGAHTGALWKLARPLTIERRENRKTRRVEVAALFRSEAGGGAFQKVIDLSEGGFCMLAPQEIRPGAVLRGWLDVDGLPPIAVSAVARHARALATGESVVGCSFESIDAKDQEALAQFLSNRG